MSKYIVEKGEFVIAANQLDHILAKKDAQVEFRLHSVFDGLIIEDEATFYNQVLTKTIAEDYDHTDHLFISMRINGIWYCYVSLDNSVRANQNGRALKNRLSSLCEAVKGLISECDGSCVIFFSESCRPSFDGSDLNNRINEMSWFEIREYISEYCDLNYLGESTNNEDSSNMALGVSAFCTTNCKKLIHSVLPKRILTTGFGSGTIGIKMKNTDTVWGINFPLDFRGDGEDNLGAKTMKNLCTLMKTCPGNSYAFGDFNTIPGKINNAILNAIDDDMKFVESDQLTYFGSYYDTIKVMPGDSWTSLI